MTRDELDCSQPSIVFVYLRSLNARGGGGGGGGGGGEEGEEGGGGDGDVERAGRQRKT